MCYLLSIYILKNHILYVQKHLNELEKEIEKQEVAPMVIFNNIFNFYYVKFLIIKFYFLFLGGNKAKEHSSENTDSSVSGKTALLESTVEQLGKAKKEYEVQSILFFQQAKSFLKIKILDWNLNF